MNLIQKQIVELRARGLTHARIGDHLGIATETVDCEVSKLRKAGVDLPIRSNGVQGIWTAARIAKLKALHAEGKSAGIIAGLLCEAGVPVSRNAVIGKIHRLGLETRTPMKRTARPSRAARKPAQRRIPVPEPVAPRAPEPLAPEPPVVAVEPETPTTGPVNLMALRFPVSQCRWIDGEPAGTATVYCGAPVVEASSYCPEHAIRCYQPRMARRYAGRGVAA